MQTQEDFKAVMQFLDYARNKGLMNSNTAASLKAACAKIEPYLEKGEKNVDWIMSNIDQIYRRVFNKDSSLKPDSLKIYQARTKRALDLFIASRKDPTGWDRNIRHRDTSEKAVKLEQENRSKESNASENGDGLETTDVNYPLRKGFTFKAKIPRDIKMGELQKLLYHLVTLAEDFNPVKDKVWYAGAGGTANPSKEIEG